MLLESLLIAIFAGIAGIGFIIALYDYFINKKMDSLEPVATANGEEDYSDGI